MKYVHMRMGYYNDFLLSFIMIEPTVPNVELIVENTTLKTLSERIRLSSQFCVRISWHVTIILDYVQLRIPSIEINFYAIELVTRSG
jgi:hypothetical protein